MKRICIFILAVLAFFLTTGIEASAQPVFSKSFQPSTIGPGSVSTLVFVIDNSESGVLVTNLSFTDNLPAEITIAAPANVISTCSGPTGSISAADGASSITLTNGAVGSFSSCAISVNVTASTPGLHDSFSGNLTSSAGNSGSATARLTVDSNRPGFSKSFSPSSVQLGERSTLTFTVDNTANPTQTFHLNFIDNLPTGMELADPVNAATTCTGGLLTAEAGSGIVSYTFQFAGDASVGANSSCTIVVDVIATGQGQLGNVSGVLTSSANSSGMASDVLEVSVDPLHLGKSFTDDPAIPGATATLQFTITNFDRSNTVTGITFSDDLDATLPGLTATGPLPSDPCGAGSTLSGTSTITLTGGNLAPGASCTFSAKVQIPAGAVPGTYPNTTSSITGNAGGTMVTGSPASESLFVNNAPILTKQFLDDPVGAGDTVSLQFTITNTDSSNAATNISFTDVLTTFLPQPINADLPSTPCGAGSSILVVFLGTDQGLLLSNGNLNPGDMCTFTVDLDLPVDLPGNTYVNTTSKITATVNGQTFLGPAASDEFTVLSAPSLIKEFTDDPVDPGQTVTLAFTLEYPDTAPADATGITFTDDLSAVMPGLVATGLPMTDLCGPGNGTLAGSSGDSLLTFTGGSLAPDESCTFSVTLQTPMSAIVGSYPNTTSDVTATISGKTALSPPATNDLLIGGLNVTKEFTDDPVIPGGTTTLGFTIENNTGSQVTDIVFSDSLSNVLSGLAPTGGLPLTNPCGTGSSFFSAGNTLFLTGGNLGVGESCNFDVTLQVPAGAQSLDYPNVTSQIQFEVSGQMVSLSPVFDILTVDSNLLFLEKEFTDDPVVPGGNVTLEFTLTNLDSGSTVSGITFTDDLGAALTGLAATSTPVTNPCGMGSSLSGTSVITLTGASLAPSGSCTFSVNVSIPAGASTGTAVTNTTSTVSGTLSGLSVTGNPASDELLITQNPPPAFTKKFSPDNTAVRKISTLTFTINNAASEQRASKLAFTDNLPTGVVVAPTPNVSSTCLAPTITAAAGSSAITMTAGGVDAQDSCTVSVDVQGRTTGTFVNTTGKLSSNLGMSGKAKDTLTVFGGVDFGDAPDGNYKTLLANNGASHGVGDGPYLGGCVDTEADGQPGMGADGDDGATGVYVDGSCTVIGDDEDGVVFTSLLAAGQTANITVTASEACTLSGWVDFNADGDWSDTGETLFPTGELLSSGSNNLSFSVPAGASIGGTYARFRCSTSGVLQSFGEAIDGEVEDYPVSIVTVPTVNMPVSSNVTETSATLGATVASDNGNAIVQRGVVWSTSANPTVSSNDGSETSMGTTGAFTISATGLSTFTTYHYRGFATNGVGTGYTNDAVFQTDPSAPTVTTVSVDNITLTSAQGTGNITGLGIPDPTAHGMVWSTSSNPTIADQSSDEGGANSTGTFTSQMTGLTPYTDYYARAYATNTATTAYGEEIMFHTGPEIVVEGNSNDIGDGDTTTSETNHTDFGDVYVNGGQLTRTYTIYNNGDAVLSLSGVPRVQIGGPHMTDFSVATQPAGTVASNGSTAFEITFDPTAGGLRSATVSIANDDEDENPFTFAIQGEGLVPEISVEGNSMEIADGDTTPSVDDDTDFGVVARDGGTGVHTFTIRNSGDAPLNLTGGSLVDIGGANPADFTVSSPPSTPVAMDATTTFDITFNPTDWGIRAATVSIANDDPDENPYTFDIQGNGFADDDNDGASNFQEAGPNGDDPNYDGNNDGIADRNQSSVASLPTFDGQYYVTLVSNEGFSLENVAAVANPSPGDAPAGIVFTYGFFEFTITGVAPGGAATLDVILPPGAYVDTYWKYGPSFAGTGGAHIWYEFIKDGPVGATVFSNVVTLHFVDGLLGDDILTSHDGRIVDQGGPGLPAALIPSLTGWGIALLAALLVIVSAWAMGRIRRLEHFRTRPNMFHTPNDTRD